MKAKFTFSDKTTAYSEIIISGYSKTEVFYNDLKQADNSVKFSIPFSIDLANKIKADYNNNIKCSVVNDDNTNDFTGYVRKTINFTKTQTNQPISLEIVSPSFLLDKQITTTGKCYIEKTVSYIITDLLSIAGFTDIGTIDITNTIPFLQVKEDDNIKEIINELCFEYSKTFDFDNNGIFNTYSIFNVPDSSSITQKFNGGNSLEKIQIAAKEKEADYVEASWNEIKYFENTLLFSDTTGQTDTAKCVQKIAANSYFGGVEYNELKYDSTLGTVLYATSITPKIKAATGIKYTLTRTDKDGVDLGTSANFSAKNTQNYELEINQLDIYGNAYIQLSAEHKNVSTTGTKKKTLELKYLHDEESVKTFIQNLANYYRYANNTITLKSKSSYSLGSFVAVEDYGTGKYFGRVTKKVYSLSDNSIEYTIETISDFTPATVSDTKTKISGNTANRFTDFTAPTAPVITLYSANDNGTNTIVFSASTDEGSGVSQYRIYRKEDNDNYSVKSIIDNDESVTSITYIDRTPIKNKSYSYYVIAVDNSGNFSSRSNVVSMTSVVDIKPNLATNLLAVAKNADNIKLTWTDAVYDTNENIPSFYNIEISRDSGTTFELVGKSYSNIFYYTFDRSIDLYPEKTDLDKYRFRIQTVSVNNVKSVSYVSTTVDYSVYGTWIPSIPTIAECKAEKDGIKISWNDTNNNFYGSKTYSAIVKYSDTERTPIETKDKTCFYTFDRKVDFYPEKSTLITATYKLSNYKVYVKSTDIESGNTSTSLAGSVSETSYKQWLPLVPTIESNVVGRCSTLIFTPNVANYGDSWKYRVQIKKISDVADTSFYKPDVSTDPYSSITAYKNGEGYYTSNTSSFQQTLPLNGQNDTNPAPVSTTYSYSVIAENESGAGTASTEQTITALATGATDIVNSSITENKIADGAITADKISADSITGEKIAAMDLSATKAYFSKIAGNKGADSNNFWSGLDTTTPEFRVGNDISLENTDSDDAEYIHYKPSSGILFKVKNFILTSVASIIKGVFRIKKSGNTDANSFMTVNPTDSTDDTTGTEKQTVKIRGTLFADNYHGTDGTANTNAPAIIIDKPDTGCIGIGDNGESQTIKIGMSRDYKTWSDFTNVHLVIQGDTKSTDFIGHLQGNADTATIADRASSLSGVGGNYGVPQFGTDCITAGMSDSSFDGSNNGWAHYLIFNHGDGSSYYHYNLRFPFWDVPQYQRQMGDTSNKSGWKNFITSENIGSQSVNHATTSTNLSGGTVDATSITDSGNARISGTLSVGGNSYFAQTTFELYNYFNADIILKQDGCGTNEYPSGNIRCGTSGVYMARPMCALSFYWNGSSIANKKSYNVSSITRIGVGQYRVLLTNPVLVDRMNDSAGSALSTNTWYNRADNDEIKKINLPMSMSNIDCNTLNQCLMSITEICFSGISNAEYTIRGIGLTAWDNQRDTVVDVLKLCQGVISYYPRV